MPSFSHRLLGLAAGSLLAASAQATTLDFDDAFCAAAASGVGAATACGGGSFLNQAYGDTAAVNVSYLGDINQAFSMFFWPNGYSGLTGLAYGASGATARLTLAVQIPGQQVQLDGLTLGSWLNSPRNTAFTVRDLGSNAVLFSQSSFQTGGASPNVFNFGANQVVSGSGLVLDFGPDMFNVGLDSLRYTVSAVPEPSSWALLVGGLALVVGARRRLAAR
jgi:PEP-CTERM motif